MKDSFHANTKIIGLLGHPIEHSFSPFVQNVAFEFEKMDYIYLAFDVPPANLKSALMGVVALGMRGLNVTRPHKEKIIQHLDELSEEAATIGAINTVINDQGKLIGYNTDVTGIIESLTPFKEQINGSTVTVFGAGGGARVAIYALIRHFKPEKINIINRTVQRADSVQNYFSTKMRYNGFKVIDLFPPDIVETLHNSSLIINATSIGMFPEMEDTITDLKESFSSSQIVFDLIYNPPKTKFLQLAEQQGAIIVGGLKMLVSQAAKSFELWTGREMPVDKITKSLELYISK